MFDTLSDRLGSVFDRLKGRGALSEQDVRDAMREELARDESVFVMGEDIGHRGGVFLATDGFIEEFLIFPSTGAEIRTAVRNLFLERHPGMTIAA